MDEKVVTLVVGLAGIVATSAVGGLGLYFNAKMRTAKLRESLFDRQLEAATRLVYLQGRIRLFLTILLGEEAEHKERAREDLRVHFLEFSQIQEKSAVFMPAKLWVEIRRLEGDIADIAVAHDRGDQTSMSALKPIAARMTKVALLSRVVLGADELTDQSMALYANQKAYERCADLELSYFESIASRQRDEGAPSP